MRKAADPQTRLEILRAVLTKTTPKDRASAEEMAEITHQTWRNLKKLIDADPRFPIERRGAEGLSWIFHVQKVLKHLIAHYQAKVDRNQSRSKRIAQLSGGLGLPAEDVDRLDVAELSKLVAVNRDMQRVKTDQKLLIPAAAFEAGVMGYNTVIQAALLEAGQRADPVGTWAADVREAFENEMRNALVAAQAAAEQWLRSMYADPGGGTA